MRDYNPVSEVKRHIKSLFDELLVIESSKHGKQEDVVERVLYLMEIYINQEVERYVTNLVPAITHAVMDEIRKEIKKEKEKQKEVK